MKELVLGAALGLGAAWMTRPAHDPLVGIARIPSTRPPVNDLLLPPTTSDIGNSVARGLPTVLGPVVRRPPVTPDDVASRSLSPEVTQTYAAQAVQALNGTDAFYRLLNAETGVVMAPSGTLKILFLVHHTPTAVTIKMVGTFGADGSLLGLQPYSGTTTDPVLGFDVSTTPPTYQDYTLPSGSKCE